MMNGYEHTHNLFLVMGLIKARYRMKTLASSSSIFFSCFSAFINSLGWRKVGGGGGAGHKIIFLLNRSKAFQKDHVFHQFTHLRIAFLNDQYSLSSPILLNPFL